MLMRDIFEAVEEAVRFRGMKANVAASDAARAQASRDRMDADRNALIKSFHVWKDAKDRSQLIDTRFKSVVGEIVIADDADSDRFTVVVPPRMGSFSTLKKAKEAVERERGI